MGARTRVTVAAAVIAVLTGGGVAAAAAESSAGTAASPAPSGSTAAQAGTAGKALDGREGFDRLAARLHVTTAQLDHALTDAKRAVGESRTHRPDAAVFALVAKDLGITQAQARQLVLEVFGDGTTNPKGVRKTPTIEPGAPDPQVIRALASVLGVSEARAAQVLEHLDAVYRHDGRTQDSDPAYRRIAASLGLTPAQLDQDLVRMKQTLAATLPKASGSPAPGDATPEDPASSGKG